MANSVFLGSPDNDAIRELRDAAVELNKSSTIAGQRIIVLTWVLVVLTAAIFILTAVLVWKTP